MAATPEKDSNTADYKQKTRPVFRNMSPLDYRYYDEKAADFLSEEAFVRYMLKTECALVRVFHRRGICSAGVVADIEAGCQRVTPEAVYEEEERIGHDVRSLVNCIRNQVSEESMPFVHMTATSFDIRDTATAARFRDATEQVALPALLETERALIDMTLREADRYQIGRTHGQHAVPITVGHWTAGYVSRFGHSYVALDELKDQLVGKFSGAVGAYNASSLFFNDPEQFEKEVLGEMGLEASDHSTQIVQPEPRSRLLHEYISTVGVAANLADDVRNLQRTEIGEVGEKRRGDEVRSSTMPHKGNPIVPEGIKSVWKVLVGRGVTVDLDAISDHQRDLTNSLSSRTEAEIIAYALYAIKRSRRALGSLVVNQAALERNLNMTKGLILSEPLYILLAAYGHPDAHEKSRLLSRQAEAEGKSLQELAFADQEVRGYIGKMTGHQLKVLQDPMEYIGIAPQKARVVAESWKERLGI